VRREDTGSWLIQQGSDLAVDMALYIRDALALSVNTDPDIPLLEPAVPVSVPAGVDRAAVTAEWTAWWAAVLDAAAADQVDDPRDWFEPQPSRPGSITLSHRPAIREAVCAFEDTAGGYFADVRRQQRVPPAGRLDLGHLVRSREAMLGRPARPFRLVITELPVAGLLCHRQTTQHLLISARFARDIPRRDAALRQIVTELA
jgi:hypothetical protein